jgi:hypothetical protein
MISTDAGEPFDRVVIRDDQGRRELTKEQFLSLPLSQRIRCVIERTATFYNGVAEVDRHRALNGLRRAEAR